MVTQTIIKTEENQTAETYSISGKCGNAEYHFEDICDKAENAEIIDKMLSAAHLPENLVERTAYALAGILTEV